MGYAFISYSSSENQIANQFRNLLHNNQLQTWMAPHDIPVGSEYSLVIDDAISNCSCLVVLLSNASQNSVWVSKEAEWACRHSKPIVPIAIEDITLDSTFEFLLDDTVPWKIFDFNTDSVDLKKAIRRISELCSSSPSSASSSSFSDHIVFLSYKSADLDLAERVYHFLTERGHNVFFSERSLPNIGNSEYFEAIDEALDKAQHMVIIADSREKLNSKWVKHEWSSFLNEKRSGRKNGNLVVVITENMKIDQLPYSLRQVEVIPISELEKVCCFLVDKTNQKSSMQIVPDSIPAAHQRTKQKKKLSKKYVPLAILVLVLITGWLVTALPKGTSRSAPGPTPSLISNNEASSDTRSPDGKRATPTVSIAMNSKYFSVGDQVQASWSTVGLDFYTYSIVKDGKTKLQFTLPTTKEKTTETITYTPEVPGTYYVHVTGYQIINGEKTPVVTVQKPFDVAND